MTTFVPFAPAPNQPVQFQLTLDGQQYVAEVRWNLAGQRWYVTVSQLDQTVVFSRPLIGSDIGSALESLSWAASVVTAKTIDPHGLQIGATIDLTISGVTANTYNGLQRCLVTGVDTFTYALASNPGPASILGTVAYDMSMTAGYFASTLVFRTPNQTFEISP